MSQILKEKEEVKKSTKKSVKKNKKKINILKKLLITLIILIILGTGVVAFLLYGPYSGFRDWYITSAMTTMTHQWLAYLFFDEDTVEAVLGDNRVEEIVEDTDVDTIVIANENDKQKEEEQNKEPQYANEFEREILEKDEGNDDYKIIEISGKGYSGYLAAVYNPSKIHTLVTAKLGKTGQYLTTMAKDNKAKLAINGGGFYDPGHNSNGASPLGVTYANGKMVTNYEYLGSGGIIGFNKDDKLVLSTDCTEEFAEAANIRDCVTCGPFLIVNGKASTVVGNGGWGTAPRTAIGQRKDGVVLFLVIDGRTLKKPGADMDDLIEIMERYGAYNAANLDGGTSTVMVVDYKMINDPIDSTGAHKTRFISTGFGVIDEE